MLDVPAIGMVRGRKNGWLMRIFIRPPWRVTTASISRRSEVGGREHGVLGPDPLQDVDQVVGQLAPGVSTSIPGRSIVPCTVWRLIP